MILAGELNQLVTFQAATKTTDALNATVMTWVDQVTVPARVRMINGREVHAANQFNAATTIAVRIRKGPAVTPLWRALWTPPGEAQRILNIQSVLPLDTRDGWDLLCSEGLNDG